MGYKKSSINVNDLSFTHKDILAEIYKNKGLSEYFLKTLNFCREWLSGKETFILSTSGSTGKPKQIEISANQMKTSAEMTLRALGLNANDNALVCLNTSYIAGIMMLVRGMVGNLNLYVIEPVSNPFLQLPITFNKIDFVALVPMQMSAVLSVPESREKISKVRSVILGGAPVTATLDDECQILPSAVYETYGMTETVSHIALRRLNGLNRSKYFQVFNEIEIDTDSRECLKIRSVLTNNEWLTTNDKVKLINDKNFEWLGRVDHVINSGAIKIQIEYLENKISPIFKKLKIRNQFLIASLPHKTLGEAVILLIEGNSTSNIDLLKQELSESLYFYEVPKEVIFLKKFCKTPTGKINRKETIEKISNQNIIKE